MHRLHTCKILVTLFDINMLKLVVYIYILDFQIFHSEHFGRITFMKCNFVCVISFLFMFMLQRYLMSTRIRIAFEYQSIFTVFLKKSKHKKIKCNFLSLYSLNMIIKIKLEKQRYINY